MDQQDSELSLPTPAGNIPLKWQEKYLIKRIDEEDIQISLQQRNAILQAINHGDRFVQVGKYTLMLNGIKSIDPKWGPTNIPPRPNEKLKYNLDGSIASYQTQNQEEIDLWDKLFGDIIEPLHLDHHK